MKNTFRIDEINTVSEFADYMIDINQYQEDFDKHTYDDWMNHLEDTIIRLREDLINYDGIVFFGDKPIRLYRAVSSDTDKYGKSWTVNPNDLDWAGGVVGENIYYIDINPDDNYVAFYNYLDCIIEVVVANVKNKYTVYKCKQSDIKVLPDELIHKI